MLYFDNSIIILFLGQVFAVDKLIESDDIHSVLESPLHIDFSLMSLHFTSKAFADCTWLLGSFLKLFFVYLDF